MIKELLTRQKELEAEYRSVSHQINVIQKSCKHDNKEFLGRESDPHGINTSDYKCIDCDKRWSER